MSTSRGRFPPQPFWPASMVQSFDHDIPVLYGQQQNMFSNDWPKDGPSWSEVAGHLSRSNRAWFRRRPDNQNQLFVLSANFQFVVYVRDNYKLGFGRLGHATNRDRVSMLREGTQINHWGFRFLTGHEMRQREFESAYVSTGNYTRDLLGLIDSGSVVLGTGTQEDAASEEEEDVLQALQTFVDSEFELEERIAQQEPGFYYRNLRAVSRRGPYRQFYDVELDQVDYERMLEVRPTMLAPSDGMGLPSELRFEVTDLRPQPDLPVLRINVERQTQWSEIPRDGQLLLSITPTLQKVRSDVLESLRGMDTSNPWLLKLLANEYDNPEFTPGPISLRPLEHPPTDSQRAAIDLGANVPDYCLVLGPPGTGKTTVISSWVRHFVESGKRVLVTSQNNRAVDNVIERLIDVDGLQCVRIGNEARISSTVEDVLLDNKVRDLQRTLFAEVEASVAHLERSRGFLRELESNLTNVGTSRRAWLDARAEAADEAHTLSTLQSTLQSLESAKEQAARAAEAVQNRVEQLEGASWPWIMEHLRKLITFFPLRSARRELQFRQSTLIDLEKAIESNKERIEPARANLTMAESRLGDAEEIYSAWFTGRPDDYVAEVQLPGLEDFSPERLLQVMEEFDSYHRDLVLWHQKLSGERQQSLYPLLLEGVDVVGATCVGINTRALFRDMEFDVVIVDEAGQIQAHNLVVPLSRAPKAILVGDHKQLPPVVQDEIREEINSRGYGELIDLYENSLFERLWDKTPDARKVVLSEQFRCPSVISDYVSKAFYEDRYSAGAGMDQKSALLSFCPSPLVFIDTQRVPGHFESSTNDGSRLVVNDNPVETGLVVELLRLVLAERPDLANEREIAVIVPYRNHVARIQQSIRNERRKGNLTELDMPLVELVASIDSFQGQERELVIMPFTRSNRRFQVGFLRDWRRLNVALTRAKGQAIAIGDVATLASKSDTGVDREFKSAMRLLVSHCESSGSLLDARTFFRR